MKNKETLEEVAEIICHTHKTPLEQANEIVKLLQERSYSEEDLEVAFFEGKFGRYSFNDWFEQFKKK